MGGGIGRRGCSLSRVVICGIVDVWGEGSVKLEVFSVMRETRCLNRIIWSVSCKNILGRYCGSEAEGWREEKKRLVCFR